MFGVVLTFDLRVYTSVLQTMMATSAEFPTEEGQGRNSLKTTSMRPSLTLSLSEDEADGVRRAVLFQRGVLRSALLDSVNGGDDDVDCWSPRTIAEKRNGLGESVKAVSAQVNTLLDKLMQDLDELTSSPDEDRGSEEVKGEMSGVMASTREETSSTVADSSDLVERVSALESELKFTKEEMKKKEALWTQQEIDWKRKEAVWERKGRLHDMLVGQKAELQAAVKQLTGEKRRMHRLVDILELMNVELQQKLADSEKGKAKQR